mgnify:CR=1 FL=1
MMGPYSPLNLLGILIQSIFVENMLLAYFLGMCTYLACSSKLKVANSLGIAVVFVLMISGVLNWIVHETITGPGALAWLEVFGIPGKEIDLGFLEFLLFISVIAGFVQILEIIIERFSPSLYSSLGIYLPLITVNCAILGTCLFAVTREYPFIPNLVYVTGSAMGWWLAIVLMAAISEKLRASAIYPGFEGMGITFIMTGLMAMAFMGLAGINLRNPTPKDKVTLFQEYQQLEAKNLDQ